MEIERQYKFNRRGKKYKAKYLEAMKQLFMERQLVFPFIAELEAKQGSKQENGTTPLPERF